MVAMLTRAKDKLRIFSLSMVGINAYPEGTVGSYLWKENRSLPLSEEEMSIREMVTLPNNLSKLLEAESTLAAAAAWVGMIGELVDDLPRPIRERFMKLPVHKAKKETDQLLLLSEYVRGKTTVRLANRAWIMSITALLVSVITLLVSACTLYMSFFGRA